MQLSLSFPFNKAHFSFLLGCLNYYKCTIQLSIYIKLEEPVTKAKTKTKQKMGNQYLLYFFVLFLLSEGLTKGVVGLACNWGLQSTHPLPPNIVVKLMKENGFDKVKLFEADPGALKALGKSGIQVMVGIPNDLLAPLASSVRAAEDWVQQNVSKFISLNGVNIRLVFSF